MGDYESRIEPELSTSTPIATPDQTPYATFPPSFSPIPKINSRAESLKSTNLLVAVFFVVVVLSYLVYKYKDKPWFKKLIEHIKPRQSTVKIKNRRVHLDRIWLLLVVISSIYGTSRRCASVFGCNFFQWIIMLTIGLVVSYLFWVILVPWFLRIVFRFIAPETKD